VGEKTHRERRLSVLEVSVDDAVAVKVIDGIKDGPCDNDSVVLCEFSFCEDSSKQLSGNSKFKGEIVFCARLKALVKLDLGLGQDGLG